MKNDNVKYSVTVGCKVYYINHSVVKLFFLNYIWE